MLWSGRMVGKRSGTTTLKLWRKENQHKLHNLDGHQEEDLEVFSLMDDGHKDSKIFLVISELKRK